MRATLEELRAMSDNHLQNAWLTGEWPFDTLTKCARCLVHHAEAWMGCRYHPNVTREATRLIPKFIFGKERVAFIREHLEEFIALRLFYDSLYSPSEEVPSPTDALAESCSKSEVGA